MRYMKVLSERLALRGRASILVAALSVLLMVGVLAASCGGNTTATTAATPTTVGSSTTVGAPGSTAGGGGAQVVMKNSAFDPVTLTIKAGESVTWTNEDSARHTVVADNGEFKSGDLAKGATFSFAFDKAGTYPYHCSVHPSMKATVVVE
jgi:plastocyanin